MGLYRPKFGPQFLTAQNLGRQKKFGPKAPNDLLNVDSGVLQSAGFDYKEDGVQKRIQLNIPSSRFGISPDDDVAASKRKYIQAILRSMKTRTADSQVY